MIKTLDNQTLKKGSIVWGIGITVKGVYMPYRAVVHSINYDLANPNEGYFYRDNAQKECDKRNKKSKKQ